MPIFLLYLKQNKLILDTFAAETFLYNTEILVIIYIDQKNSNVQLNYIN